MATPAAAADLHAKFIDVKKAFNCIQTESLTRIFQRRIQNLTVVKQLAQAFPVKRKR
jgi:hypothetical protein